MLEIYITANKSVHKKVKIAIARHICGSFAINFNENGKPYVEGDPLFFSITHSKDTAVFALSDKPVGIDLEFIDCKRKIESVLLRFTDRELSEINGNLPLFYENWVVKEAYIKLICGTIAHYFKQLEYVGKLLYCDGKNVDCNINVLYPENGVICAICGGLQCFNSKIKRFRLRKGESLK
ncbi:MAG: 4'-phosphopantetheinyl transferase superfamily protein [Clostridia bacterium]|nr:4'-phosphopantetheinyl transferase superfamily protein [Clostridia bacterium]